jgi:hypothetical protein
MDFNFNDFALAGNVAMVLPFGRVAFHHWTSLLSHSNIGCLVAGDGADAKILQDKE